jgi:hypothetical protein
MRAPFTSLLVAAAISLGISVGDSHATVLIFDQTRDATQTTVFPTTAGSDAQQDYGDNVTGSPMNVPGGQFTYGNQGEGFTPNVVADYFSDTSIGQWTIQYGDLTNVLFARSPLAGASANTLNVRLTADPGFEVQLYHFDLAGWADTDYTISGVSVFSDTATLFAQSNVLVEGDLSGPRHTAFDFATPLSANQLQIQIDFANLVAGMQDNIGIDNIRFGQDPPAVVPLAPALWLFGSGLLALIGISRRNAAA